MPRHKLYSPENAARQALELFWHYGYHATSIDDLVNATRVSRHGLYAEFGDKRGMFLTALELYIREIVNPVFAPVERPEAGLPAIRKYFRTQIWLADQRGLPGPGCLLANSAIEMAPHDGQIRDIVSAHLKRLHLGFYSALAGGRESNTQANRRRVSRCAQVLTLFAQGLWSYSRVVSRAAPLYRSLDSALLDVKESLGL